MILEEPAEILEEEVTIAKFDAELYRNSYNPSQLLIFLTIHVMDVDCCSSCKWSEWNCIIDNLLDNLFHKQFELPSQEVLPHIGIVDQALISLNSSLVYFKCSQENLGQILLLVFFSIKRRGCSYLVSLLEIVDRLLPCEMVAPLQTLGGHEH